MDLLLQLISKHKLDILDIEITELLNQYLRYIEGMPQNDLEQKSEFLEMAARLVHIKTMSLLPRHSQQADELKAGLSRELMEYSICRRSAELLGILAQNHPVFVRNPMAVFADMTYTLTHPAEMLSAAAAATSQKTIRRLPVSQSAFSQIVRRRTVSVTGRVLHLLRRLNRRPVMQLSEVFAPGERGELIATFLALLELVKAGRVKFTKMGEGIALQTTLPKAGKEG